MVQLTNLGHLCGGDWRGPRVDWRDLARHAEGVICLAGAPAASGLLGSYVDQADDPDEPVEALAIARRLAEQVFRMGSQPLPARRVNGYANDEDKN